MTVYEIGTDGRLARLPEMENSYGAPDLTGLALNMIDSDNTRWYNINTSTITRDEHNHYSYTVAYQRVAIANVVVRCELCAEENGYYNVYDIDRVEAVPAAAYIYDGDPTHLGMRHEDFVQSPFYQYFTHIYTPSCAVYWMSTDELKRNPHEALAASWADFVYGVIDGKG